MDIKIQTKISVLLEKIHYLNLSIQQQGGTVGKVDKDLLTNYVRELYETVLMLQVQNPGYPDPNYMQQSGYHQPVYAPQLPYSSPEPPQSYQTPPNGFSPPNASPIGNQPQQPNFSQFAPQQQTPLNGNGNGNGNYSQPPNGTPQPQQQPLNQSFSFSNGKRTLSESIRIKTGETEKPSLNDQFRKDDKQLHGQMQVSPIKDLKTFIGLNKRFSYINFLFGNDANLYDEAIEKLNTSGSKQSAFDYLNNHLRPKLKWTDDNELVEEFFALVDRRYL